MSAGPEHHPAPATGAAEQRRLAEPMRSRWSPSVFDPSPAGEVADGQLASVLSAGSWAPSSGNSQPWAFLVLRRGTEGHAALVDTLSRGNLGWVPGAPVVLVAAYQCDRAPGEEKEASSHAAYDLGQAVAHLSLQATALGLATHQLRGFDQDRFATLARVPAWFRVMTGIALGRHGDPASAAPEVARREERERHRRGLPDLVHVDTWGHRWAPPDP